VSDRDALRDFLVFARSRTDPARFPQLRDRLSRRDPRGRRLPGLTQNHMDLLLGRPSGTYHRIERTGTMQPADLERIGRILALSEDEWRAVWSYAFSVAPPRPLNPAAGRILPQAWQDTLDSLPMAAYVLDEEGHLVGYNDGFVAFFDGEPVPRNLWRWSLLAPGGRRVLGDWRSQWAPWLCRQLRCALARNKASGPLNALMSDALADEVTAEVLDASSRTGASTAPQSTQSRPIRHPELGPGWITLCAASPADSPGARLTIARFRAHRPGRLAVSPPSALSDTPTAS
jgi:hypothetical protein